MELRLIPHAELGDSIYAEFYPGECRFDHFWSKSSLYMDWQVFQAVCFLVGYFNPFGPETLSGRRLSSCIEDLQTTATRIAKSESPEDIWPERDYGPSEFRGVDDWKTTRRELSIMLRELAVWMRGVQRRGEPVTCLA
jgi:hypothetical protein